jgi:hypothetical protein
MGRAGHYKTLTAVSAMDAGTHHHERKAAAELVAGGSIMLGYPLASILLWEYNIYLYLLNIHIEILSTIFRVTRFCRRS